MKLNNDVGISLEDANCEAKLQRIDVDKCKLTLTCKCGKTKATYEINDPSALITERILEALKSTKEGKPQPLLKAITRDFTHTCNICGRQNKASVKFSLTDKYFKRLDKRLNNATDKRVYKGLIEIETKLKGAHIPNNYGDARDLLFACCGSCLQTTTLIEPANYFENLCEAIKNIIKNENYPKPQKFNLKFACPHCLKPISAKITINVRKPKTIKELLDVWDKWKPTTISTTFEKEKEELQTITV